MPEPERIVVSIEREGEVSTYRTRISGFGGREAEACGLALGPGAEVHLSSGDSTLGELLRRFFPGSVDLAPEELAFFDQRTQLEIGHHLFDQLFGKLALDLEELVAREGQELRIVTNDEHLVRLPWVLLAYQETVLAKGKRWAVSLARDRTTVDVSMRSLPRVLLVMPEPAGMEKTGREEHETRLRRLIEEKADTRYHWAGYWKVVRTWQEFSATLAARDRDVIYFYGHGEGDLSSSRLLFETSGEEKGKHAVTMEQIALALGDGEASSVRLIYLNCCSGDAGGFLGAGMQLRAAVPAVLTNRTFVRIPMAQQSGEIFFEQLFVEGALPHAAYAALCKNMVLPGETARSTRPVNWMTPVLHARYGRWESSRLRAAPKLPEKSTALQLFDRSEQGGALNPLSSRLRSAEAQGGHAVLWYGGKRQGVGRFHQHLRHGLSLPGNRLQALEEFGWPPELAASGEPFAVRRSLVDGFCATLGIVTPEDVSRQLRAHQLRADDTQRIACYLPVSFPFPGAEPLPPDAALELLLQLLEAFDEELVPFFEEPFVPVLGLAVEASDPGAFRACLRPWMQELRLERIKLVRLPPLEAVKDYEVESHLQDIPLTRKLRPAERDEVVRIILEETAGRYDDVVDFLSDEPRLSRLAFQVRLPKTRTG